MLTPNQVNIFVEITKAVFWVAWVLAILYIDKLYGFPIKTLGIYAEKIFGL